MYDTIQEIDDKTQLLCLHNDKEGWYAQHFLVKLIFALRTGPPKNRAALVEHLGTFRSFTKERHWKDGYGMIGYLVRTWMAFYDSFDFGSAIHNAMKLPGDKHFNGILVGALADAMYGCGYYMVKKKFNGGCLLDVSRHIDVEIDIVKFCNNQRTFYTKNNAATNVERHVWINAQSPYEGKRITK